MNHNLSGFCYCGQQLNSTHVCPPLTHVVNYQRACIQNDVSLVYHCEQCGSFRYSPIEFEEIYKKYNELTAAVVRKFPGEERHETALRYIREAESRVS